LICLLAGGTLFFSVNAVALRTFSHAKLQEAFKAAGRKSDPRDLTERLTENVEDLILTCYFYRLIFNMFILLTLVAVLAKPGQPPDRGSLVVGYALTVVIAMIIFSVFSIAIPHAWAKYAGEKVLSRTHKVLSFSAVVASPTLYIFRLYDGFVRRLAGIAETTPEEEHEEKQEEFLTGLEQHRTEGALDAEEQEMIENVLELSSSTADEIMAHKAQPVEGRSCFHPSNR